MNPGIQGRNADRKTDAEVFNRAGMKKVKA